MPKKKKTSSLANMERLMLMKQALPASYWAEVERMLDRRPRRALFSEAERFAEELEILEDALERTLPTTEIELAELVTSDRQRFDAIHSLAANGHVEWLDLQAMPGELGWAAVREPPVPREDWPKSFEAWLELKPAEREALVRCPGFDPLSLGEVKARSRSPVVSRGEQAE